MQLTTPKILIVTATNLESVNLSPLSLGKHPARKNVNKLEVEDKTVTITASVSANDIWKV